MTAAGLSSLLVAFHTTSMFPNGVTSNIAEFSNVVTLGESNVTCLPTGESFLGLPKNIYLLCIFSPLGESYGELCPKCLTIDGVSCAPILSLL